MIKYRIEKYPRFMFGYTTQYFAGIEGKELAPNWYGSGHQDKSIYFYSKEQAEAMVSYIREYEKYRYKSDYTNPEIKVIEAQFEWDDHGLHYIKDLI